MKYNNIRLLLFALIIMVITNSCIDYYKISTKINPDGSLERTITVVGDSSSIFEGNLVIPTDSSWEISTRWFYEKPNDTTSDRKYEYTATRLFKNHQELNDYLKVESDTTTLINIETNFQKKFRWFYTYFRYTETYKKSFPFNYFPIENFLTDKELSYTYRDDYIYVREKDSLIFLSDLEQMPQLNHEDSLRMEELENEILLKLSAFMGKNTFEAYFNFLCHELQSKAPEKSHYLNQHKDSIYQDAKTDYVFDLDNLFSETKNSKEPLEALSLAINYNEDSIKSLNPEAFQNLNTKTKNIGALFLESETIKNSASMPGLLINTNADSISSERIFWNFNEKWFLTKDFQLYTESRTVNKWAFIVTGFFVLLIIIFLFRSISRK